MERRPDSLTDEAPMRVLGIDPGLHRTGYGCVEWRPGGVDPVLVEGGVLRLRSRASLAYRLAQLHEDLDALLDELQPGRLAVESLFSHPAYARTAILMGHARGVILLAGERRRLPIDEVVPAAVKKSMTGNGRATKQQMQMAVMGQCNLAAPPSPSDVADAIAIALCSARRLTASLV